MMTALLYLMSILVMTFSFQRMREEPQNKGMYISFILLAFFSLVCNSIVGIKRTLAEAKKENKNDDNN